MALVFNTTTVDLTTANTEYSFTTTSLRRIVFRCRNQSIDIRYSFTTGDVATPSGSYMSLSGGNIFSIDLIAASVIISSWTIYFGCAFANQVIEIDYTREV